jgi:hypothetical protein
VVEHARIVNLYDGVVRAYFRGSTRVALPGGRRMPFALGQFWVVFGYGAGSSG